jgi:hypothetical protein
MGFLMSKLGIAASRTPRLGLIALVAASAGMLSLYAGLASASGTPASCPSPASIKAAAGEPLKAAQSVASPDSLVCSYTGRKKSSLSFSIVVSPRITATLFDAEIKEEAAKDKGVAFKSIHGLGYAAAEFAENDGKLQTDGDPAIVLSVYAADKEIILGSNLPSHAVVKVARTLVG